MPDLHTEPVPTTPFYEVLDEDKPGGERLRGRYRASTSTAGPWDAGHQHGGPPTALLVRAVERLGAAPDHSLVSRAVLEILGPIPVDDVDVLARTVRPGGRVALAEAELRVEGRAVARMSAWRIRTSDVDVPATPVEPAPGPGEPAAIPPGWGRGYLDAVAWRTVEGGFDRPGPATAWASLRVPVVAGDTPSGAQRVAAVADSGSGISAVADPRRLLFVNTELTLHLLRAPGGDDVWMRSTTWLDRAGIGLARSVVGDVEGAVGSAAQSLFVAPR